MFHDHHNYRQHQSPQRSGKKNRNIQASIMIDPTLDSNKEDDGDGIYEEILAWYIDWNYHLSRLKLQNIHFRQIEGITILEKNKSSAVRRKTKDVGVNSEVVQKPGVCKKMGWKNIVKSKWDFDQKVCKKWGFTVSCTTLNCVYRISIDYSVTPFTNEDIELKFERNLGLIDLPNYTIPWAKNILKLKQDEDSNEWDEKKGSLQPDFTAYFTESRKHFDIFVVEVKKPGHHEGSDLIKLGYMMRRMLLELINEQVEDPVVLGMIVSGYQCSTYRIEMQKFNLQYHYHEITLLNTVIASLYQVKILALHHKKNFKVWPLLAAFGRK
ncbi:hypothetical protein BDC45DRAFT_541073 [Circinella umbellata]|nr:hypothetical protein BDC45DRAFT_541073 [Circinella umbellata]